QDETAVAPERFDALTGRLTADGVDGVADALPVRDFLDALADLVPRADDDRVGPQFRQLLGLFGTADDVDRAEAVLPAQADAHGPQGAAGGRLEQPGALGDLQDVTRQDDGAGRVDEERGGLLVAEVGGDRHRRPRGDDHLFGPVAAVAVEDGDALAL